MADIDSGLIKSKVVLTGDWTEAETKRISAVLKRIERLSSRDVASVFNGQETTFRHSTRAGRAGRTIGGTVELDAEWTDWTLAHELGHRWNNAWQRRPERDLRTSLQAGRLEWLKRPLRRFEKWLEQSLKKLGAKTKLDWQALWYHPGSAAPPCGSDRNFNASEDLAECFAASVFPEVAKERAAKAAKRVAKSRHDWDWGKAHPEFGATLRGQFLRSELRAMVMIDTDQPSRA
ncbi:MAG: hypothetical protein H0S82_03450 [Anaerolineaceae bacterium]|nr:hypothetical protein [Anaerolineaceae bacterium]